MNEDEFAAMTGADAPEGLPVEQDTEALLEAADMEEAGEAGFEGSAAPDAESGAGGVNSGSTDGSPFDAVMGEAEERSDDAEAASAAGAANAATLPPAGGAAALPPAGGVNSSPRDYRAEVSGLLAAYPELRGKSLPEEVIAQCVDSGRSLTAAYTGWLMESVNRELRELRAENETLRQNASAAVRAPVRAALSGGSPGGGGSDPFLSGFDADY